MTPVPRFVAAHPRLPHAEESFLARGAGFLPLLQPAGSPATVRISTWTVPRPAWIRFVPVRGWAVRCAGLSRHPLRPRALRRASARWCFPGERGLRTTARRLAPGPRGRERFRPDDGTAFCDSCRREKRSPRRRRFGLPTREGVASKARKTFRQRALTVSDPTASHRAGAPVPKAGRGGDLRRSGVEHEACQGQPVSGPVPARNSPCGGARHRTARPRFRGACAAYRNVRAHAGSIDDDECAIQDVESPFLDEQDRRAILDRDGVGRRYPRCRGHCGQDLGRTPCPRTWPTVSSGRTAKPKARGSGPPEPFTEAISMSSIHVSGTGDFTKPAPRCRQRPGERSPV